MTDREPDDLFDALRDRLADYGQEPPAPLWASIRAQLPPPVAAPRLRKRRGWAPVALLVLLFAAMSGVGWRWWRTGGTEQPAPQYSAIASNTETSGSINAPALTNELATDAQETAGLGKSTYLASPRPTAVHPAPSADEAESALARPPVSAVARQRELPSRLAGRSFSARHFSATPQALNTAHELPSGTAHPGIREHNTMAAGAGIAQVTNSRPAASRLVKPYGPGAAARAAATPAPSEAAAIYAPDLGLTTDRPGIASVEKNARPAGLETGALPPATYATGATEPTQLPTPAYPAAGTSLVTARIVALQLLAAGAPVAQTTADTERPRPRPAARRWAALVLAGPALTHRQLGAAGASGFPSPNPGSLAPTTSADIRTKEMAQQEHPSGGFGVQAQVRRMLSGRWSLSAGLGYQEYASQTSNVGAAVGYMLAPIVKNTHRDTYRFLTVPVRLGYALGATERRLHLGLLAGADAAVYLGGSTLDANGSVANWSSSNSPYRTLSVVFSTGLDVRYRLTPRLELVGQPTATYFLTSLTKPVSGLGSRYPWAAGALFGVSFDLR